MVALLKLLALLPSLVLATPLVSERAQPRELESQSTFEKSDIVPHTFVDVETRSLDEIYEAAKKENGTLRVGWGGDVQRSKAGMLNAFKKKFPNIDLDIEMNLSKYLDSAADRTYKTTNGKDHGFDVVVMQTTSNFPRWKSDGRLLPYKVISWDDIYSEFVDDDGAYTGAHIFSIGTNVYNPNVTKVSLPNSYLDYLQAQWANKIILTYPNDDDAVLYLFKVIVDKYGLSYIHSLQAQNVTWVRGTATPSILISNTNPHKDIDPVTGMRHAQSISFASSSTFATGVATYEHPDVRISWPQTAAIFSTTTMPETSKLFLNFLMDDGWQSVVSESEYATRRKFDKGGILNQTTESGLNPLAYVEFMEDRRQVESFRFELEHILGTAVGANPVDVW
ncbi:periplasmic binding protein-like II [Pholiota conissans]|uniref:Periplasmic binding protein-like II n=1 Tax=Pholiota conissans TaxID=109636 RepID=A0A9P6D1J3_9AGAR|nr:periplasmic binding protein-like II [Pholiota conissans]